MTVYPLFNEERKTGIWYKQVEKHYENAEPDLIARPVVYLPKNSLLTPTYTYRSRTTVSGDSGTLVLIGEPHIVVPDVFLSCSPSRGHDNSDTVIDKL
jgi:hypothetical protein